MSLLSSMCALKIACKSALRIKEMEIDRFRKGCKRNKESKVNLKKLIYLRDRNQ
jgi:hypothetical protein